MTTPVHQAPGARTVRRSASATTTLAATLSVGHASVRRATVGPGVKRVSPSAAFISLDLARRVISTDSLLPGLKSCINLCQRIGGFMTCAEYLGSRLKFIFSHDLSICG